MTERKLRVFLCHSSQDKPIVRELYQRLSAEGWIDPWLDEEKLLPGQVWDMEIEKAVEAADVVIVCLSNQSVTKEGYVQRELRFALDIALEKPEGTIFIIPLKLEDCEPPRKLRTWQYVEYFPADKRDNSFRLIKVSMQERLKSLGLTVAANDLKFSVESLSSKIISKKISDARLALQNDQLQRALEIYDLLIKQRIKLKEIISDLEDVSVVYSDSSKLWSILANAYRMDGDISRAKEYEKKINDPRFHHIAVDKEPEVQGDQDGDIKIGKQDESSRETTTKTSEPNQQSASVISFLPSTISLETSGGLSTPLFYKGDALPLKIRETFSTATDNQPKVEIHLVFGENKLAKDNTSIGKFILDEIPPAPKGIPQIEILIEISQDLELDVRAIDKTSGRMNKHQIVKLNTFAAPPTKDPLPPKPNPNSDKLFDGELSDFFKTIFGMDTKQSQSSQPARGYQKEVVITLEEAYQGTTRSIQKDGREKLVRIPAGVYTGSKVRVAGGGPNGLDLYWIISVPPHQFLTRNGLDLHMRYPISEELASRGGKLQVPVLEKSKHIYIAIPPNTKDKQVFRFPNRGIPNVKEPKKLGDFYLTVEVYNPQNISQELKKLINEIKNYMR